MNETKITNIVLDKDRFTVFATILGNEEEKTFTEEVTVKDIREWVRDQKQYYQGLKNKEGNLIETLVNKEL
jgi:hypothetical protein